MPKKSARPKIPAKIADQVKKEFSHLCAACGARNPQLHHIDLDHSNNDPLNLIPLCPNHHLTDAHNPTSPIEPGLIRLLRLYRNPSVLSPKCLPLYLRLQLALEAFDTSVEGVRDAIAEVEAHAERARLRDAARAIAAAQGDPARAITIRLAQGDPNLSDATAFVLSMDQLVRFVGALAMGGFYSVQIQHAVNEVFEMPLFPLGRRLDVFLPIAHAPNFLGLSSNLRPTVEGLIMEQLRFQDWTPPA